MTVRKLFAIFALCVAMPAVGQTTAGSTVTGGSIATANAYQSVLPASVARVGCMVFNTSANTMMIYLGAPGAASAALSIPLPASGSFNCSTGAGVVINDQISLTSATAGSTFLVIRQ